MRTEITKTEIFSYRVTVLLDKFQSGRITLSQLEEKVQTEIEMYQDAVDEVEED